MQGPHSTYVKQLVRGPWYVVYLRVNIRDAIKFQVAKKFCNNFFILSTNEANMCAASVVFFIYTHFYLMY